MTFLKLLLSSNLICIATMAIAIPTDKISERTRTSTLIDKLSDYILPLHYNVKLELNDEYFIGRYVITIYIIHATKQISFHIDSMGITESIKLKLHNSKKEYFIMSTHHTAKGILLEVENVLLARIYDLFIRVKIPIDIVRNSLGISYISNDGNKEWLITSGIHTRIQQIFPFWNRPELKTTFNISIMHFRKYKALSNMPIQVSRLIFDEMRTYFKKTDLISIDNIAFVVTNFHRINLTDTISMWCKLEFIPHLNFTLRIIKNVTMYFENYFHSSKEFDKWSLLSEKKVDHVVIPNLRNEYKQILGIIFYSDEEIMYNQKIDHIGRKIIIASLVTRKMIQQYVGNLLNPFYCFQVWLNKGFIIFLQAYIVDEIVSDFRMMDLFVVQIQHELLDLNTYMDINSVTEYYNHSESNIYSFLSHTKGSIIWRMLERTLSSNIFLKSINIYLNIQYIEMERTSDSLWKAMQSVIYELDPEYQIDVRSMVQSWTMQRCFPILEVMRNYISDVVTISIQFQNKLDEEQYYIPVTYTTESKPNFTITWSNIRWLTSSNSELEFLLEKDQWIILNLQQAGYYRVNYYTENWQKIARYLNSKHYRNIHVLNRAQIIDDAFHFAIQKKLKYSVFWELATYLQKEKDYIAWYPMLKIFEFMSNIFALLEFYPEFQKMLKPLELKWRLSTKNSNNDHFNYLNQELANWKCNYITDISCKTLAKRSLEWHLENPEKYKIPHEWKRWTYCNGLKMVDRDTWDKVFREGTGEINHKILECLAYIKDSKIIIDYLAIKLPTSLISDRNLSHQPLKVIEQIETLMANIFLSTLTKSTRHMLDDILNNLRKLIYICSYVNKITALVVIINNVYSKGQLDKIKEFIKKEFEEPVLFDVERKIETRTSELERQTEFLKSLFMDNVNIM